MTGLPKQSPTDSHHDSAAVADSVHINPKISANLRSDYEALQNDMRLANQLAADFQRQLAGKSNDFALLKQVFEKTREDLGHLHAGIAALREERHRLANEAMKAAAYQMKLGKAVADRDRLRIELEVIRNALDASKEATANALRQRDRQIAELTVENAKLKQALLEAVRKTAEPARSATSNPAAPENLFGGDQPLPEISFS